MTMVASHGAFIHLCCDCLRIREAGPQNDEVCVCGGDMCNCDSCRETAERLRAGERGNLNGELNATVMSWTHDGGAVSE